MKIDMKRMRFVFPLLISALALLATVFGCGDPAGSGAARSAGSTAEKSRPEQSFELIFETFRRGVEDIPIGFVVQRGGGHSMMSGRNEVSHELIRPAKEGEPYRAIITVDSQARYSLQESSGVPEEEQQESPDSGSEFEGLEPSDENGTEIFDPSLVTSSGSQARRALPGGPDKAVHRVPPHVSKRDYELVYRDGRWALVTKLDPETEQSIENAFEQALKTQI